MKYRGPGRIYDEVNFIRDYLSDKPDLAITIIEARATDYRTKEMVDYVFAAYPDLDKLCHWQIALLLGCSRESITRDGGLPARGPGRRPKL